MKNKVNRVKEKIEWIQNLTVVRMVQGAMRINKDNQLSAFAAQAAFFLLLSFFPFAMMLLMRMLRQHARNSERLLHN